MKAALCDARMPSWIPPKGSGTANGGDPPLEDQPSAMARNRVSASVDGDEGTRPRGPQMVASGVSARSTPPAFCQHPQAKHAVNESIFLELLTVWQSALTFPGKDPPTCTSLLRSAGSRHGASQNRNS